MIPKHFLVLVFFTLVPCKFLLISAQQGDRPSGVQGIIHGIIKTGNDITDSAMDLAEKSTFSLKYLLRNAVHTLVNNPITRITVGFRNRAVGSSLVMLRNAYVEGIDPVIDTIQEQIDQLDELRDQIKRTRVLLKKPMSEIQRKTRCLTSTTATQISADVQRCALIPLRNTISELQDTQQEVQKVYQQLRIKMKERGNCLEGLPKETVLCAQSLVAEIPAFVETINSQFVPSPSLFEQMIPIQHCVKTLNARITLLCPKTNQ